LTLVTSSFESPLKSPATRAVTPADESPVAVAGEKVENRARAVGNHDVRGVVGVEPAGDEGHGIAAGGDVRDGRSERAVAVAEKDRHAVVVGGHQVGRAVAPKVDGGQLVEILGARRQQRRRERAVAVVEKDGDDADVGVQGRDVGKAVVVEVGDDDL